MSDISAPISFSVLAIQKASTFVGVEEQPRGSNAGPMVNQFHRAAGSKPGDPWCMAFVCYVVLLASNELKAPFPLVKTPGVMDQWTRTKARKLPARSSGIKPGDIFIMKFGSGKGHTGFVEKIEGGLIHTIEGNTNEDGSREGYEVARRQRPISSIFGFIQLP